MFLPSRRAALLFAFAVSGSFACGGGGSPAGPGPNPTPTTAPTPASTPTPDPRAGLAPGPIIRFTIKPRIVEPDVRDPDVDSQGRFILHRDERVDIDGTQKNASNEICVWINPPVYLINDQNMPFGTSNGVVFRRGSSQPFLLKMTMEGRGTFGVRGSIDGIESNVLQFVVN
jgi:hypothetical protein